jgi:tetratricopeptide (TPR) repeat protein
MQDVLKELRSAGRAGPASECPENVDWDAVVAGQLPEAEAMALLKHAAGCSRCGTLLRNATQFSSGDATPEEEAMLAAMPSSRTAWREEMILKLQCAAQPLAQSNRWRWPFWRSPIFLIGAAVFAVLMFTVWIVVSATNNVLPVATETSAARKPPAIQQPSSSEALKAPDVQLNSSNAVSPAPQTELNSPPAPASSSNVLADGSNSVSLALLAQAYTEHRTIDMRFRGAMNAPIRVERSARSSNFEKPAILLEAEAMIAKKLTENPGNVTWLDARAQADLLDGQYDPAIKTLRLATEAQPNSIELIIDLATAYVVRGEQVGSTSDLSKAYDLLSQALLISPKDPVARFNIALER